MQKLEVRTLMELAESNTYEYILMLDVIASIQIISLIL